MENKAIGGHGLYRDGSVAGLILEGFLGAKSCIYSKYWRVNPTETLPSLDLVYFTWLYRIKRPPRTRTTETFIGYLPRIYFMSRGSWFAAARF